MVEAKCILDENAIDVISQVIGGSGEVENLEPENIKHGVTILGVEGTFPTEAAPTITANAENIDVRDYATVTVDVQ